MLEAARTLDGAGRILHLCHASADADTSGAAYCGLRAYGGDLCLGAMPKLSALHLIDHLGVKPLVDPDFTAYDLVAVYDAPDDVQVPLPLPVRWMLVDHHPNCRVKARADTYVLEDAQACCLVVETLLEVGERPIDSSMALALAAGTVCDTRFLKIATPETLQRVASLMERALTNLGGLISIVSGPGSPKNLREILQAFRTIECWSCGALTVGLAFPTSHVQAFQVANALFGQGMDLLLAVFRESSEYSCMRLLLVSPRLQERFDPAEIVATLARTFEAHDFWSAGLHAAVDVDEMANYVRANLETILTR